MNELIQTARRPVRTLGWGNPSHAIAVDGQGRLIPSPLWTPTITANGLDIRALSDSTDSVAMTASNLDIRVLSASRDSIKQGGGLTASASQSEPVAVLTSIIMLQTDISDYSDVTFLVLNQSLISVSVTVEFQIAPQNVNAYYLTDGSSYSLLGGDSLTWSPSMAIQWARVRVTAALSLADITAYFFGRA